MEGDVIKATIEVDRQVFHNGDDWGIYSVLVDEVISDYKPVTDYKNRITIKGNMPELKLGELYNLVAKEVDDNRYGLQYDVKAIFAKVQIDENDKSSKIIKWHQIEALTKASKYKNIVAGFILNFRLDNGEQFTYFFNIKDFNLMRQSFSKKSFNIMDVVLYGAIKINGYKKRTRWHWQLDEFFESLNV